MNKIQFIFLLISATVSLIHGKLQVSVYVNDSNNVTVNYNGIETRVVTSEDIKSFKINSVNMNNALKKHYGRRPNNYYLKSPTPWGDLYKKYNWEQVKRVLLIQSATLKSIRKVPIIVLSQEFENLSQNRTITVNTGLSHTVENSITSSWTSSHEVTVSQEVEYDFDIIFAKMSGTTGISYTSSWGKSIDKTETVTIGTTSSVETELGPGQIARAVLTASRSIVEVEVAYVESLRGNVAVNFKKSYEGHHFMGPQISSIMKTGDLNYEIVSTEAITIEAFTDASLKVFDKSTGMPL